MLADGKIDRFNGDYRFLSNFYPCDILYNHVLYPSTEHAYQAQKSNDFHQQLSISRMTAGEAKRTGSGIILNDDWDSEKVNIMYSLNKIKYSNPEMGEKLLATGEALLIEGNWWNDKFWGICLKTNKGENMLGNLLMGIRSELRAKKALEVKL